MRPLTAMLGVVFASATQVAMAQTLPERFQGVWKFTQGQPGTCKQSDWNSDAHTDDHIKVDAQDIDLHETKCRFTSDQTTKPDHESNAVRLMLSCAGEGEKWQSAEIWQILTLDDKPVLATARISRGREYIFLYQQCERTGSQESSESGAALTGAVASLPLKPGFYVASDTACGQASNGTLSLVRRSGMNVSRRACDFTAVEQSGPARYRVTAECNGITSDTPDTETWTYEVSDDSTFKSISPDGTSYAARYCAQSSLPEPWRDNDISDLIQ